MKRSVKYIITAIPGRPPLVVLCFSSEAPLGTESSEYLTTVGIPYDSEPVAAQIREITSPC